MSLLNSYLLRFSFPRQITETFKIQVIIPSIILPSSLPLLSEYNFSFAKATVCLSSGLCTFFPSTSPEILCSRLFCSWFLLKIYSKQTWYLCTHTFHKTAQLKEPPFLLSHSVLGNLRSYLICLSFLQKGRRVLLYESRNMAFGTLSPIKPRIQPDEWVRDRKVFTVWIF